MGEPTFGGEGFRKTNEPSPYDQTPEQRSRRAAEIAMGSGPGILTAVGRVRPVHVVPGDLAQAVSMEKSGYHPQEIWDRLGMARGADRFWREEMPGGAADPETLDAVRKVVNRAGAAAGSMKLGDVASKEFAATYPELMRRKFTVSAQDPMALGSGGFNPHTGEIFLDPGRVLNLHQMFEHEAQHGVQGLHGFNAGASPVWASPRESTRLPPDVLARVIRFAQKEGIPQRTSSSAIGDVQFRNYLRSAGETEARNAWRRLEDPSLRRQVPSQTEDIPRKYQNVELPRNAVPQEDPYAGVWRSPLYESGRSLLTSSGNPNLIRDETTRMGGPFVTKEWKPSEDQLKQIRRVQKWLELIKPKGSE
jgi:hypothetical protein